MLRHLFVIIFSSNSDLKVWVFAPLLFYWCTLHLAKAEMRVVEKEKEA